MTDKIRILFLAADPIDIKHIRLDQEVREIDERINAAKLRDRFSLIPQLAVRTKDLHQALLRHEPHIVHFSGHGSATEGIFFEDDLGRRKPVSQKILAELFALIPGYIRIVVMNACYSRVQANSISKVIDFTIGMKDKIGDQSAILFSSSFYLALAHGRSVKQAFGLGVLAIKQEGIAEDKILSLLVKKGVDDSRSFISFPQTEEAQASKGKADMKQELPSKKEQPVYTGSVNFHNSPPTANEIYIDGQIINQGPKQAD